MSLDKTQRVALATHIRANVDTDVVTALAGGNHTELARLYNLDSTTVVWRESISPEEYREGMVWSEVDTLTVGSARIWEWITQNMTVSINATKDNVRAGLADVFGAGTTTRTQLLAIAKENATLAESIYAVGTGDTANPAIRGYVGVVTISDIGKALIENP